MFKMLFRMLQNRAASNALWIVVCKSVQAVLGLLISMISARMLGPANYGLLYYAASLVLFVTPVAQLGMTSTLVQELIEDPAHEGEILGTAMLSTLVSSVACIGGVLLFANVSTQGDTETMIVCGLYSLLLLSQSAELIQYWFQTRLLSRYTSVATLIAYALVSVYQLIILASGKNVRWFAVSKAVEYAMIAAALMIIFFRKNRCRLSFRAKRLRSMLQKSWHYMLSSLLPMTFSQADRLMIKAMIGNEAVGFYSAAVVCANATDFFFFALIDTLRPIILQAKLTDEQAYEKNICLLYLLIVYFSLFQSVFVAIFAKSVVYLLYGTVYGSSIGVLRILIWYTAFSYIGSARSVWILAEGKQHLLWKIFLAGALVNILLNCFLIPAYGIEGAAFASLIAQMFANVIIGFIMPSLRKNNQLLLRGIHPGNALRLLRSLR